MSFDDHFSAVADGYARARLHYPDALFDWIAHMAPATDLVWEPACGSGQATQGLAPRFDTLFATSPAPPNWPGPWCPRTCARRWSRPSVAA